MKTHKGNKMTCGKRKLNPVQERELRVDIAKTPGKYANVVLDKDKVRNLLHDLDWWRKRAGVTSSGWGGGR